ncbi:MAG: glycosyltransferase family 4 protein [Armatimonadetes bacterium]|nr:glycosyltransferase family 4 protein [Armatimonadota bacterium]
MPGVKIATTIFDVLPLSIPEFLKTEAERARFCRALQRDILRSDVIITCSEYSKTEIMRHFRVRSEPEVIHIGVTLDNVACSVAPAGAGGYFLYVGGYGKRKGVEGLVRVFLGLHRERLIRSRLVLTGDRSYYSEEFRALVRSGVDLGLVEELGYVSESALPGLYRNAIALVYPSKYEGFGLPPLEAMSVGCPVITTRCTAIPEVCGDAAYYIDPDDERDFGAALIALETNSQLRTELAARGARRVKLFSWGSAAQRFLDILSRLVQK